MEHRRGPQRAETTAQPRSLPEGALIDGRWRIEQTLRIGSFATTYRGRHEQTGDAVAIREYFPRELACRQANGEVVLLAEAASELFKYGHDRFIREAETLARVEHKNLASVLGVGQDNGTAYSVFRYETGERLSRWRGPPQDVIDGMLSGVLSALETLHSLFLLHGRITPDDILIRPNGEPVLLAPERARHAFESKSGTLSASETPCWAPEQYSSGSSDDGPWTDIYGLAATCHYAMTGSLPLPVPERRSRGADESPVKRHADNYRREFLSAIDWGLRLDQKERPESVAAWRAALLKSKLPASLPLDPHFDPDEHARLHSGPRRGLGFGLVTEYIVYEGRQREVFNASLEPYFDAQHPRPNFRRRNTAETTSHVCGWSVADERLYLTRLDGTVETASGEQRDVSLTDLFGGGERAVPATWYSGELVLPDGQVTATRDFSHNLRDFPTEWASYIVLVVDAGVVTQRLSLTHEDLMLRYGHGRGSRVRRGWLARLFTRSQG